LALGFAGEQPIGGGPWVKRWTNTDLHVFGWLVAAAQSWESQASTVQGLHQAFITLQVQAQKQTELLNKMQMSMGMPGVKQEVSLVDGHPGGAGFGSLFDRRRGGDVPLQPKSESPATSWAGGSGGVQQTSLAELAGVLGGEHNDDDPMGGGMDDFNDVLGEMVGNPAANMLQQATSGYGGSFLSSSFG
jgi:hypothetical protein